MSAKLDRVGHRHPEVCQAVVANGTPCEYRQVEGAKYCFLHGGAATAASTKRAELRNYILTGVYAKRAQDISNTSHAKNLSDELALCRVSLETIFNNINGPNEMLLHVDKIDKIVRTIEGLVNTTQKLQERGKELIDRETLFKMTDKILEIIVDNFKGEPDALIKMSEQIHGIVTGGLG
jgi:hypothetical protein